VLATLATPAPARADEDARSVAIGARTGVQSIYLEGDGSPSDLRGFVFGADGQIRVARRLTIGLAVEGSLYDRRSDRLPHGRVASSVAPFLEVHADTNPEGPLSARIDLGTGARWLTLPVDDTAAGRYAGIEALRLRIGPGVRLAHGYDLALQVGFAFGWFAMQDSGGRAACAVTATCKDSLLDSDTQSSVHFTTDLTLALRVWP
jgi:hypothetical protein